MKNNAIFCCGWRRKHNKEIGIGDNPFQPTTTAIDGEIVSFHPSDLDMSIEENTTEPEEYQPLPVYPIVEPEIEEIWFYFHQKQLKKQSRYF